jgi:uncharacterized protein (DUF736 family)
MATTKKKKVGVGWAKTSQDGTKHYVSIVINGGLSPDLHLVMFKNGFKEEENQPDYIIYLSAPKDGAAAPAEKPAASEFPGDDVPDDDIPF